MANPIEGLLNNSTGQIQTGIQKFETKVTVGQGRSACPQALATFAFNSPPTAKQSWRPLFFCHSYFHQLLVTVTKLADRIRGLRWQTVREENLRERSGSCREWRQRGRGRTKKRWLIKRGLLTHFLAAHHFHLQPLLILLALVLVLLHLLLGLSHLLLEHVEKSALHLGRHAGRIGACSVVPPSNTDSKTRLDREQPRLDAAFRA